MSFSVSEMSFTVLEMSFPILAEMSFSQNAQKKPEILLLKYLAPNSIITHETEF